jgi:hypothetical protein
MQRAGARVVDPVPGMGEHRVELGRASRVVEVPMGDDHARVGLRNTRYLGAQAGDAQPGVHHQVAVAAAQPPDVGLQERVDMRLVDLHEAITGGADAEPGPGDGERHGRIEAQALLSGASVTGAV